MNRLNLILLFLEPALRTASSLLKAKDENSTGVDDEAAAAIDHLLTRLEAYRNSK